MQMIKLENMHKSYFDCFEDCFTSIIHSFQQDYMFIFAEAWRANLHSNNAKNLHDGLLIFSNTCRIVDQYCGLASDIRIFYNYEHMKSYIQQCIREGKPVMIAVDMYQLPWSEAYHVQHRQHIIILNDYVKEDIFKVFDVTKQIDNLDFNLKDGFDEKTITVVISKVKMQRIYEIEEVIDAMKKRLQQDVSKGGYESIRQMANDYFKGDKHLFVYSIDDIEAEPFIDSLLAFGRGRISYSEFLKHVEVETGNQSYAHIITELGLIGAKWLTLRKKVMKLRVKGTFDEKKSEIGDQILNLVDEDYAIYERFLAVDTDLGQEIEMALDLQKLNATTIDLRSYFNANAFNSNRWENTQGFDFNGYFYELDQADAYYEEAHTKIRFAIDQKLDHISCSNQTISIAKENVKAIMVIGSCENGDYSENITINYTNGEENIAITYPDWWETNRFGESIVKKCNCMRFLDGQTYPMGNVYIYSQLLSLEHGEGNVLESITLPDCSNIHIFGIIAYIA